MLCAQWTRSVQDPGSARGANIALEAAAIAVNVSVRLVEIHDRLICSALVEAKAFERCQVLGLIAIHRSRDRRDLILTRATGAQATRVPILASIGAHSTLDLFIADGTFDRAHFIRCCQDFVHGPYPWPRSAWVLDGAAVHTHLEVVHYLQSVGVVPLFFPVYCHLMYPIEYLFGFVKQAFQRHIDELANRKLLLYVVETTFEHCGWRNQGYFDPVKHFQPNANTSERDAALGFSDIAAPPP
ncbi:TPA: hypothetical protein N0F65_007714 [Lagenidium giganteum]|uniref:Tc1-like transposase DDE domain-containing protein n=1 Tax=Lagenidium giganteum TaxID=4803 RepID=A0AAV2Z468_9STRA|nr:TPA: hypothetical protein N0F65_007714 [Lagenidium giganteum]